MDENSSLLSGTRKENAPQNSSGTGMKVKVAQGAILITITLERLAFYSLAGNLVLFLNKNPYQWKSYNSMYALFFFFGISYLMSFFGGLIADTCLGRFKSLLLSVVIYLVGYLFLPLMGSHKQDGHHDNSCILPKICGVKNNTMCRSSTHDEELFSENCAALIFGVLTMIAVGSGPFRSNIAPFGADQVRGVGQQANLTFFNWYYWCVNLGSLIALGVITYIQQHQGFYVGYLSSFICLAVGAAVFLCGSCCYVYRPRTGSIIMNIFKVLCEACSVCRCCCCKKRDYSRSDDNAIEEPNTCLDYAKYRFGGTFQDGTVDEVKKVIKIVCVFLTFIPYWMVYFQMETTFLIQGLHMNLNLPSESQAKTVNCTPQNVAPQDDDDDDRLKPAKIVAAWFSLFDVIFVVILIPVFDRIIYPRLAKAGRPMGFVLRVSMGMAIAASAVCVAGVVENYRLKSVYQNDSMPCCRHTIAQKIDDTMYYAAEMSIFWQIPQYALIGLSEVFASIAALEFAYQMAPKSAKGIIMGLFYLFTGVGSILGVASMSIFQGTWFGHYDNGNINCRVPCTCDNDFTNCTINQKCHMDFYFFSLAGVELLGLLLFLLVVRLCHVQREITTVTTNQKSLIVSRNKERLKSPVSVQRQTSSDLSVT